MTRPIPNGVRNRCKIPNKGNPMIHPDPQLNLFQTPQRPEDPDAALLIEYLSREYNWKTRAQIMADLGFDDRRIRAARKASNCQIIAGQNGFRHIRHCTPDERAAAPNQFESQGKNMLSEAAGYRRAATFWNFFDANRRHRDTEFAHV